MRDFDNWFNVQRRSNGRGKALSKSGLFARGLDPLAVGIPPAEKK
jgi:hypothetical protein